MSLTREEVEKIAHLARLNISSEDIPQYTSELSAILHFIEALDKADTTQVQPLAHALDIFQRLRPDEITAFVSREKYQKIAPQVDSGLYLVPKVKEA